MSPSGPEAARREIGLQSGNDNALAALSAATVARAWWIQPVDATHRHSR
jgi:hypothetical protein